MDFSPLATPPPRQSLFSSNQIWLEDGDGKELLLELPNIPQNVSLDSLFLRDVIRNLYPSYRLVNCYELYTIYVRLPLCSLSPVGCRVVRCCVLMPANTPRVRPPIPITSPPPFCVRRWVAFRLA